MAKNIMVVVGSPRKKGNSATLAAEVVRGAKGEGAKVETVFLHQLDIRPCTACGQAAAASYATTA